MHMPDYLLEFLDKKRVRQILVSVAAFFVFFIGVYLYFMRGLPEIDILKHYQPNVVTKVFSKDGDLIGELYVERRVVVPVDGMPEHVLSRMVEEGFISAETEAEALGEGFVLAPDEEKSLWVGSYFTEHVRRHLEEKYGWDLLYRGGLNIYTTLDVKLQKAANEAVDRGLRDFDKRRGYRGPVRVLSTAEEVDAFREEIDRKLERRPLEPDDVILGVITAVDKKLKTLRVDVGRRQGVIKDRELRWARTYNPEGESDGKRVEDPIRLFNTGDVIEVRVRDVPLEPASPLSLPLEQAPQAEAALLAMEPETGYVRAMVGGSGFSKTQFNRALQARRQPGSAFKPIIYSAALDGNYPPATVVMDTPLVFDGEISEAKWRPRNYDERFGGPTTVRKAIAKSQNIITIKLFN